MLAAYNSPCASQISAQTWVTYTTSNLADDRKKYLFSLSWIVKFLKKWMMLSFTACASL